MNWNKPEFSKSQVNHAGEILALEQMSHPERKWAENVLTNWRAAHAYPINTFTTTLREKLKKIEKKGLVAQRLKRTPSIINKLKRFESMRLARMQDIAGLRAVVQNIKNVRKLEDSYKRSHFSHKLVNEKDYIREPKTSGYRGIHLVYRYKNPQAPDYDGLHLELQIRTKLQHAWATAVETSETFLGQPLKSSEGNKEWLAFFSLAGSAFAHLEECSPVPQHASLDRKETYKKVLTWADKLKIKEQLGGFSRAVKEIDKDKRVGRRGRYHLIVLDLTQKDVSVQNFAKKDLEEANKKYTENEKQMLEGKPLQVVLVSTDSIKSLRKAYPNYFLDTQEFLGGLRKVQRELEKI